MRGAQQSWEEATWYWSPWSSTPNHVRGQRSAKFVSAQIIDDQCLLRDQVQLLTG